MEIHKAESNSSVKDRDNFNVLLNQNLSRHQRIKAEKRAKRVYGNWRGRSAKGKLRLRFSKFSLNGFDDSQDSECHERRVETRAVDWCKRWLTGLNQLSRSGREINGDILRKGSLLAWSSRLFYILPWIMFLLHWNKHEARIFRSWKSLEGGEYWGEVM